MEDLRKVDGDITRLQQYVDWLQDFINQKLREETWTPEEILRNEG